MRAVEPVLRHTLLEGILLRVARAPEAETLVLRGGMLVRSWLAPVQRPADDVDLVCSLPFDPAGVTERFRRILSADAGDGVRFDTDALISRSLRDTSGRPCLQLSVPGRTSGLTRRASIDVAFDLELWPAAERIAYLAARGSAQLWVCREETLIARKLQVLTRMGEHFRPKDLSDVHLLTSHLPIERGALAPAVEATFDGLSSLGDLRELLSQPWWERHSAAARLAEYADTSLGGERSLSVVLAEIRRSLDMLLWG